MSKKKIGFEIKKMIDVEIAHELSDLRTQISRIQTALRHQQPNTQTGSQNMIRQQIQQFSDLTHNQLQQTGNQLQQGIQQTIQTLTQCLQYVQTTQTLNQINQVMEQAQQPSNQTKQQ